MTKVQYSTIFISLFISATSALMSAGTLYEIFVYKRNDIKTIEYMEIMLLRAQRLLTIGVTTLFIAFVALIISWILS